MKDPFARLYEICNTGDPGDKLASLARGPQIIDLEPTNACNLRCKMCPTGLRALNRPTGFMTTETFTNLLLDSNQWGSALRFIGWGEPVMNPHLHSWIAMAAERGRLTHVNTNGTHFPQKVYEYDHQNIIRLLFMAGLSSIKVSFQGVDRETYKDMRVGDHFDHLVRVVETMAAVRETLPSFGPRRSPFISVSTSITDEDEEAVGRFVDQMSRLCDRVSVGRTVFDFIDVAHVPDRNMPELLENVMDSVRFEKHHPDPCPEVYNKLSVAWDGSIRVCCNDYSGVTDLGNVNTPGGLESAWNHKTINAYRKRLANREYTGPLCSGCYDYMGLTG